MRRSMSFALVCAGLIAACYDPRTARAADMPDFEALEATLRATLASVHEAFDRLIA